MFSDAYTVIDPKNADVLLEQLNSLVEGSQFEPKDLHILTHHLPFYSEYALFEVTDISTHPERSISFIGKTDFKNDNLYILNGTNESIYALNEKLPIALTDKNVRTYVLFFFAYVRGRFGQFKIIEHIDDIQWREEPSLSGRKALAKMIEPLAIKSVAENGDFTLSASIVFKDTLFEADIIVSMDGKINLSNQEMLVEDIPVLDDTIGQ